MTRCRAMLLMEAAEPLVPRRHNCLANVRTPGPGHSQAVLCLELLFGCRVPSQGLLCNDWWIHRSLRLPTIRGHWCEALCGDLCDRLMTYVTV